MSEKKDGMRPIVVTKEKIQDLIFEYVRDLIELRCDRGELQIPACWARCDYQGLEAIQDVTVTLSEDPSYREEV